MISQLSFHFKHPKFQTHLPQNLQSNFAASTNITTNNKLNITICDISIANNKPEGNIYLYISETAGRVIVDTIAYNASVSWHCKEGFHADILCYYIDIDMMRDNIELGGCNCFRSTKFGSVLVKDNRWDIKSHELPQHVYCSVTVVLCIFFNDANYLKTCVSIFRKHFEAQDFSTLTSLKK